MPSMVPRRGATQASLINNLACPTLAKRPIESQYVFSRLSHRVTRGGGLHTLGLLERLRVERKALWGASSDAYFRVDKLLRELANPSPTTCRSASRCGTATEQHIRWTIAASSSVAIGHAALDTAIATYPDQRFALRKGILVIRQHP
jgi:hypothetical protein